MPAPRAISLEADAGKRFLAGAWTTVSRVGKYPQIDLTETRAQQLEDSYDPAFERAVVNLDHEEGGAALAKIDAVRKRGDLIQVKIDPASVQPKLKDAIESGAFFRPSIEAYPSFSLLEGSPAYLRGLAILGNKSAEVRGLPPIKFEAGGQTYVGLGDAGREYIMLDSADREDPMPAGKTDEKAPEVIKLESDIAAMATAAKAKDDEIAKLKAAVASKDEAVTKLSTVVESIQAKMEADAKAARLERVTSGLVVLEKDLKISPAEVEMWKPIMLAIAEGETVVKLGAGDKAKDYDLGAAVIAALNAKPKLKITVDDHMKNKGKVDGESTEPPTNEVELLAAVKEQMAADMKAGKVGKGAKAMTDHYTALEAGLRKEYGIERPTN